MTEQDKLNILTPLLDNKVDAIDRSVLEALLRLAGKEIIDWRYSLSPRYENITEVPKEYEVTQIYAVVAGYSLMGAENQTSHNENGISRVFKHSDMVAYIRHNVIPIVG